MRLDTPRRFRISVTAVPFVNTGKSPSASAAVDLHTKESQPPAVVGGWLSRLVVINS